MEDLLKRGTTKRSAMMRRTRNVRRSARSAGGGDLQARIRLMTRIGASAEEKGQAKEKTGRMTSTRR